VFAVAALAAVDRIEPAVLASLERARYEDPARDFRFDNSDLFALGPLVSYLREHPRGERRRVLFLGNSIVFGYSLASSDAVPARYQRIDTSAKVFNAGINGFPTASALAVAKAVIDSVDLTYALLGPIERPTLDPMLPRLIPLDAADMARLDVPPPNETEQKLSALAGRWRLYRDAYRLQAALFGASTRQYIYLHKGAFARALVARVRAAEPQGAAPEEGITIDAPVSSAMPDEARQRALRADRPELWQFGDLARQRRKPVVLLQIVGYSRELADGMVGDFNRVYAPDARVLVIRVPPRLTVDGMHVTGAGADALARALWGAKTWGAKTRGARTWDVRAQDRDK